MSQFIKFLELAGKYVEMNYPYVECAHKASYSVYGRKATNREVWVVKESRFVCPDEWPSLFKA